MRRGAAQDVARAVRRQRGHHQLGVSKRRGEIAASVEVWREMYLRQVRRVGPLRFDLRGQRSVARPETYTMPQTREMNRERSAPPARSEYRD